MGSCDGVTDTLDAILALGRALGVTGDTERRRVRLARLEMEQALRFVAEAVPVLWEREALVEFASCLLDRRGLPSEPGHIATLLDEAAGSIRAMQAGPRSLGAGRRGAVMGCGQTGPADG